MVVANLGTESDVLARVTVRRLRDDELGLINYYLQKEHYLESSRLAGEWLRYVRFAHCGPSPDSDFDLRGAHVLPLEKVVGLEVRDETVEQSMLCRLTPHPACGHLLPRAEKELLPTTLTRLRHPLPLPRARNRARRVVLSRWTL